MQTLSERLLKRDTKYRLRKFAFAKAKAEFALNYELGKFYNIKEDFRNAQKCLDIAFKLDPDTAEVPAELGLTYEGLGNQNKKKNNLPAARAHYAEAKTAYEAAKKTLEDSGFKNALLAKNLDKKILETAAEIAAREAKPISDVYGSADYKREMVKVLTRNNIKVAIDRALAK